LLGAFEVVDGEHSITVGRRRERCLLALLLLEPNRVVSADRLVEFLWDDSVPDNARRALHSHVARLRATLGRYGEAPRIVTVGGGYEIAVDPARVDVHVFSERVGEARREPEPARRAALLDEALRMWRGPLLADVAGATVRHRFAPALEELRLSAAEEWLAAELELGRHNEILPDLTGLVAEQPAREKLVGLHMLALYRSGRTADALAAYAALRAQLAEGTGADPGRELRDLHTAILRNDPSLEAPSREVRARRAPAPPVAPAQLPPDLSSFSGRVEQLARLDALLPDEGRQRPATVVISAIAGMAGVGKTTLAVHWAHRVRDRYPDGQLYLNLRGFDPVGTPLSPRAALRRLLTGLGVAPSRIPADLDAQGDLYRSVLADRRILLILDNVHDAEQVRPLLPGAPGCLTVVTSRSQLAGLVTLDGAQLLPVDVLSPAEARELLVRRLGAARVDAEPDAVAEIVARCGGLPLALAIVAARAAAHPRFALAALARELRASPGLDSLHGTDRASDLRTVFSWSYTGVGAPAAGLFRLLGQHPGPDLGVAAAAALAGTTGREVRRRLAELTDAHLVTEHLPGRYTLHDLLRAYAAEQAAAVDDEESRREALRRMLDHYLHTAHAAAILLDPHRVPIELPDAPDVIPEDLADSEAALAWFAVEHPVLLALVPMAADAGFCTLAWQLGWAVAQFLNRQGRWDDLIAVQHIALAAVRRHDDRTGQAHALRFLGVAYLGNGGFEQCRHHYRQAIELFGELGEPAGQGYAHLGINISYDRQNRPEDALRHARLALGLFRAAGHPAGEAKALNAIGWLSAQLGDLESAITHCGEALAVHLEIGDRWGAAHTWDSLGYAQHRLGNYAAASDCYEHALDLFRRTGDSFYTANTLAALGDTREASGDRAGAQGAWRKAVEILEQLGHPNAANVRARLSRSMVESRPTTGGLFSR
jgi:DNA-binding SARP family transcriptional activator/Flp pilus assembly protein TadD